jgi:hypothetical protein
MLLKTKNRQNERSRTKPIFQIETRDSKPARIEVQKQKLGSTLSAAGVMIGKARPLTAGGSAERSPDQEESGATELDCVTTGAQCNYYYDEVWSNIRSDSADELQSETIASE